MQSAEAGAWSDESFSPLTFGELGIGKTFICFPNPGDNRHHGGFRNPMNTFIKTQESVDSVSFVSSFDGSMRTTFYHDSVKHGRSVDARGVECDFPHSMPVIWINC